MNTGVVNTYTVEYQYFDGFNTGSATRTITVQDTQAPFVTTNTGTDTIEVNTPWSDAWAEWTDNNGNTGSITAYTSGSVNTGVVNTYTVEYQYFDGFNTGSATRTITVQDTQAPFVTILGSWIVNILSGAIYADSGASWTDLADGSGTITATSGSVNVNQTGTYILSYTKVDTAGNVSNTVTRTVNVLLVPDTILPIVTLIGSGNITLVQNSTYTELGAFWTDNIDGSGTILVPTTGSVNIAIPGVYTLIYSRIDTAGNISLNVTRTITVVTSFVAGGTATFIGANVYLSGATWTGITFSSWSGSLNLIQSWSTLIIPTNGLTIIASGSPWNGILLSPSRISTWANILVGSTNISTSIIYSLGSPEHHFYSLDDLLQYLSRCHLE